MNSLILALNSLIRAVLDSQEERIERSPSRLRRPDRKGSRIAWIIAATSFAFVVVQLDVTIVNVALPRIGAELGATVTELQWVVDAYTLSFAPLLLSAGAIGDRFGSKRVFVSGFLAFAVSSLACGLAAPGALTHCDEGGSGRGSGTARAELTRAIERCLRP